MQLNTLADLLYVASSEWYEIIENEFYGLYRFVQQFPLDFYISRENGVYYISLIPEDHSKRSRIRSRSAGHTGHSDQLSLDSGEVLSESSRSNHPVFRGSNIPEVNVMIGSEVQGLISKVIDYICNLLRNSQNYKLKAVELGNRVRDTFGTDLLSGIREKYLGLLNMLEKYPQYFVVCLILVILMQVTRIPKSDFVSLAPEVITNLSGEKGSLYPEGDTQPSSLSGRGMERKYSRVE